jgi:predicted transcriptional regulator
VAHTELTAVLFIRISPEENRALDVIAAKRRIADRSSKATRASVARLAVSQFVARELARESRASKK